MLKNSKKTLSNSCYSRFLRGVERIRTAVGAFAEPNLATRSQRQN